MEMTFKEMLNAIEGEVIVQKEEINFNKLCIDTRKIEKNNVFLAIKGANFNGNDLKYFGSQGQQKLAVLCLKLSEIGLFKEVSGFNPVILLDDIFSELDIKKRNRLLKFVGDNDIQSIITTTDLKSINKKYLNESYIYEVKNGNIERK